MCVRSLATQAESTVEALARAQSHYKRNLNTTIVSSVIVTVAFLSAREVAHARAQNLILNYYKFACYVEGVGACGV